MASSVLKTWAMLRSCCITPVTLRRLRDDLSRTSARRPTMVGADGWEDFKLLSVGLFWRWTNGTGMIGCPFRNGEIAHPTSGDSLMQCQAASPGKACATANNGCSRVRRHSRNICRSHWIKACPHVSKTVSWERGTGSSTICDQTVTAPAIRHGIAVRISL